MDGMYNTRDCYVSVRAVLRMVPNVFGAHAFWPPCGNCACRCRIPFMASSLAFLTHMTAPTRDCCCVAARTSLAAGGGRTSGHSRPPRATSRAASRRGGRGRCRVARHHDGGQRQCQCRCGCRCGCRRRGRRGGSSDSPFGRAVTALRQFYAPHMQQLFRWADQGVIPQPPQAWTDAYGSSSGRQRGSGGWGDGSGSRSLRCQ